MTPLAVALATLGGLGCKSIVDPQQQLAAASLAVEEWVTRHSAHWAASLDDDRTLRRPDFSITCAEGGKNNLVALTYSSARTEIDFHFTCPIGPTADVEDLQAAFAFAVLTELPHGIQSPGWRFRLYTPTSSVSETVTFTAAPNGAIVIGIDTPLFAVGGASSHSSCETRVDAPSPPGCSIWREHAVPLRLTLRARLDPSEL